jgi:hypothetical protein
VGPFRNDLLRQNRNVGRIGHSLFFPRIGNFPSVIRLWDENLTKARLAEVAPRRQHSTVFHGRIGKLRLSGLD